MAQHDFIISNQAFPAIRADINNAFQALASQNTGATAPTTTYPNQTWFDTDNDELKIRSADNNSWIVVAKVNQTAGTFDVVSIALEAVAYPPVGMPFPLWDNLTGVNAPDNSGTAKFIKLTAGESGTGGYNEGLLTSESVSGSAPEVTATAQIVGGDLDGQTVHLINTEESFLRARTTSGALQQDQMQRITGSLNDTHDTGNSNSRGVFDDPPKTSSTAGAFQPGGTTPARPGGQSGTGRELDFDSSDSPNARTSSSTNGETRSKNVSATFYMRII